MGKNTSLDEALQFKNSVGFYRQEEIEAFLDRKSKHNDITDSIPIDDKKIILLRFYITFNILESYFFDKTKKIKDAETKESRRMYNSEKFDAIQAFCNTKENHRKFSGNNEKYIKFYTYFKKIYMPDDNWNNLRGKTYNLYDTKSIKLFLTSNIDSSAEYQISGALRLCYHFRNNLVHGAKAIHQLDNFLLDFIHIENFLEELMNFIYKVDPKKKF